MPNKGHRHVGSGNVPACMSAQPQGTRRHVGSGNAPAAMVACRLREPMWLRERAGWHAGMWLKEPASMWLRERAGMAAKGTRRIAC